MISLSKIAYPEVKRVKNVGLFHDYVMSAGKNISKCNSIRTENINSCTAGILISDKRHFMFHVAPELQPIATIKKELEKQIEILRETTENVKGFICGGLALNNSDKESVASFNLYNTIADTLDRLGIDFSMLCGKEKGAPMDNIYSVGNNSIVWSDAFKKLFPDENVNLSQDEIVSILEDHYQFVEQTDKNPFNIINDFAPKTQNLIK